MSPSAHTVEQHFVGKAPVVRAIYDRLGESVAKFGDWTEDPKKTSIHFNHRTAFAGVSTRKESIVLTIKSGRQIRSRRVMKAQHNSANRWHHEVRLNRPSDVDAELLSWLREGYDLSA